MSRRRYMKGDNMSLPDENTLLLLHCDSFKDSSLYDRPVVNYNNIVTINDAGKFNKSFYIPDAGRLIVDSLKLPAGDFTLECFVKLLSYSPLSTIFTNGYGSLEVSVYQGKLRLVKEWVSNLGTQTADFPLNQFVHVASTKLGNKIYGFVNGKKVIESIASLNQGKGLMIGSHKTNISEDGLTNSLRGYISEIRVSDIARWTSDFTPPVKPY